MCTSLQCDQLMESRYVLNIDSQACSDSDTQLLLDCTFMIHVVYCCTFIRSTSPSRPINIRGGNVCPLVGPYIRPYVHPSTKSCSDFNEIWYVHTGRLLTHNGMPYDPIRGQGQGEGHGASEVQKIALFKVYLLRHLQWDLANDH